MNFLNMGVNGLNCLVYGVLYVKSKEDLKIQTR